MEFRLYQPSPQLRTMVQGYLEADSRNSTSIGSHTLFPNGYSGIFFNFGRLGKLLIQEEHKTPPVSIFGQIDQAFEAIHFPGSYSLGILFQPTALSKFLRVNMAELTNKTLDGGSLRSDLSHLHQQLENTLTVEKKVELLNHYLSSRMSEWQPFSLADQAIAAINQEIPASIKKLAEELRVSERHLEVQFKQAVGLSPKMYSLIVRFKRIELSLTQKQSSNWSTLDFTHHFYDQNHFIKDFKRFTGRTPSDYLIENLELGRSYLLRS